MNYTYFSPFPFNFREHDNIWKRLCPDVMIHDTSSTALAKIFIHFDERYYDDDLLRYVPGVVPNVVGSFDRKTRTLVLSAARGKPWATGRAEIKKSSRGCLAATPRL